MTDMETVSGRIRTEITDGRNALLLAFGEVLVKAVFVR
jgi:hypothetical protein